MAGYVTLSVDKENCLSFRILIFKGLWNAKKVPLYTFIPFEHLSTFPRFKNVARKWRKFQSVENFPFYSTQETIDYLSSVSNIKGNRSFMNIKQYLFRNMYQVYCRLHVPFISKLFG